MSALVISPGPHTGAMVRRALGRITEGNIIEAPTIEKARIVAREVPPGEFAISDLTLPDGSGIPLVHQLRTMGWRRTIVLADSEDPIYVRGALKAGVRAYIRLGGQSAPGTHRGGGNDQFSQREIEVLQLVSQGKTNKEVGASLGLSALTVKSHLARIARKLGTGDRAAMTYTALRRGLIS
ncbi:response regulator transcription factor [Arsenicicoccus piscis]|uniref:response regulator transcription factor n=1 Tax=Arsenicicoccus piscis TaxID=673954 RepID=UPI0024E143B0|nr:response regulator transcription factor [Arsenicicoccus piscis]